MTDDVMAEAVKKIRVDAIERVLVLLEGNRALLARETFGGWVGVLDEPTRGRLLHLRACLHGTNSYADV